MLHPADKDNDTALSIAAAERMRAPVRDEHKLNQLRIIAGGKRAPAARRRRRRVRRRAGNATRRLRRRAVPAAEASAAAAAETESSNVKEPAAEAPARERALPALSHRAARASASGKAAASEGDKDAAAAMAAASKPSISQLLSGLNRPDPPAPGAEAVVIRSGAAHPPGAAARAAAADPRSPARADAKAAASEEPPSIKQPAGPRWVPDAAHPAAAPQRLAGVSDRSAGPALAREAPVAAAPAAPAAPAAAKSEDPVKRGSAPLRGAGAGASVGAASKAAGRFARLRGGDDAPLAAAPKFGHAVRSVPLVRAERGMR